MRAWAAQHQPRPEPRKLRFRACGAAAATCALLLGFVGQSQGGLRPGYWLVCVTYHRLPCAAGYVGCTPGSVWGCTTPLVSPEGRMEGLTWMWSQSYILSWPG